MSNPVVVRFSADQMVVLGDWHTLEPQVKLGCLLPGYKLLKEYYGDGQPQTTSLRLYAIKGRKKRFISSLHDLEGLVRIRSQQEALSFVRLFTSIETHYLFQDQPAIEVGEYGSDVENSQLFYWPNHFIEPIRVTKKGRDFLIERTLIFYLKDKTKPSRIYRSHERVTSKGRYELRLTKVAITNIPYFDDNPDEMAEEYLPRY